MSDEAPLQPQRDPGPRDFRGEVMSISELDRQPKERFYNWKNSCFVELPDGGGRIVLTDIGQAIMTGDPEVDGLLRDRVRDRYHLGEADEEGTTSMPMWVAVADTAQPNFDLEAVRKLFSQMRDIFAAKRAHLGVYIDPQKFPEAAMGFGDNDGFRIGALGVTHVTDRGDVPDGEIVFIA